MKSAVDLMSEIDFVLRAMFINGKLWFLLHVSNLGSIIQDSMQTDQGQTDTFSSICSASELKRLACILH